MQHKYFTALDGTHVPPAEIIRFEEDGGYNHLTLANGTVYHTCFNLGVYQEEMEGYGFISIRRSHLVKLSAIRSATMNNEGQWLLRFADNVELPVSNRHKTAFEQVWLNLALWDE